MTHILPERLANVLLEHFENHFDSKPALKILVQYICDLYSIIYIIYYLDTNIDYTLILYTFNYFLLWFYVVFLNVLNAAD